MSVGETHGYNVPFTQIKIQKCHKNAATHDIGPNALSCKIAYVYWNKFQNMRYACHTYNKGKDKPDKVANPARGQLNKENGYFPIPVRA